MKKIILFLLVMVLAGCAAAEGSELRRNQAKWEAANINHYRFQLSVGCFCPVGDRMPMTMEVKDGEVVSIVDANGEVFPESDPMYDFILRYATIDRIFAELGSEEVQNADQVSVTYDPENGFPSQMTIDYIELAADDELYLTVEGVEELGS
ncbi:MAG: DUF6174 domain-containing protein [Anaerolineales bacterium]